jgi:hypothetical protein
MLIHFLLSLHSSDSTPLIRHAIALRFAQGVKWSDGRAKRALWRDTFSRKREKE